MIVAFDFETYPIGPGNLVPQPSVLSVCELGAPAYLTKDYFGAFHKYRDFTWIFHNSAFDLSVYLKVVPEDKDWVFQRIIDNKISDTFIREKLLELSISGDLNTGKFSLAALSERYLGVILSKNDEVRTTFHSLPDNINEWPKHYVDYAIADSTSTLGVWRCQEGIKKPYGPGSMGSEALQIASGLSLYLSSAVGLRIDKNRVIRETEALSLEIEKSRSEVKAFGLLNVKGKKEAKKLREYIGIKCASEIKTTEKGAIKIDRPYLTYLAKKYNDPVIAAYVKLTEQEKVWTTYLPKLKAAGDTIYTSYDVLKETGRTSSMGSKLYPSLNIQQLPRDGFVRNCIIPRDGCVLVSIDFSNLELCAAGQQLHNLFGDSELLNTINMGAFPRDLHADMASNLMGITYEDFLKRYEKGDRECGHYRKIAKTINLSYPGGVSDATTSRVAKETYKIDLPPEMAKIYRTRFLSRFPEFVKFFDMVRKLKHFAYEFNGRYRNNCTYCSYMNGLLMQSPGAEGAKSAIVKCEMAGLRALAFIHDELLFEFNKKTYLNDIDVAVKAMLDGMQEVLSDTRISLEINIMKHEWSKDKEGITQTIKVFRNPYEIEYERV